jgi:hypothetical protein
MPYDETKDVVLHDLGQIPNTDMKAAIRQYDGGQLKLSVTREVGKKTKTVQVFRLPLTEVVNLGEFMVEVSAKYGTGEKPQEDVNDDNIEF